MSNETAAPSNVAVQNDTSTPNSNAIAIIQSQKNRPVVWEMSQQDPTKKTPQNNSTTQIQTQAAAQTQPQTNLPSEPISPATVGNPSVLHPEDVPAKEYANIDHLQTPTPPTIQPRVKIQSVDKDGNGEPVKSLEIE